MIEWNSNLYICFVDFEKAFDSVRRETLRKLLKIYGIPDKLVNMIKAMYRNSKCAVIDGTETSQWFDVKEPFSPHGRGLVTIVYVVKRSFQFDMRQDTG